MGLHGTATCTDDDHNWATYRTRYHTQTRQCHWSNPPSESSCHNNTSAVASSYTVDNHQGDRSVYSGGGSAHPVSASHTSTHSYQGRAEGLFVGHVFYHSSSKTSWCWRSGWHSCNTHSQTSRGPPRRVMHRRWSVGVLPVWCVVPLLIEPHSVNGKRESKTSTIIDDLYGECVQDKWRSHTAH